MPLTSNRREEDRRNVAELSQLIELSEFNEFNRPLESIGNQPRDFKNGKLRRPDLRMALRELWGRIPDIL
jgi:hypothetical protein